MDAHIFTRSTDNSKVCATCGKTRNAKAHKEARSTQAVDEARDMSESYAESEAETEAILADETAMEAIAEAEAEAAVEAKPAPRKAKATDVASIWVGWRITNAAVLGKGSLVAKLQDAKPTADLDRTVRLTVAELNALDKVAAKFMEPGHTGPEIFSGRTLRRRIAEAKAKLGVTE